MSHRSTPSLSRTTSVFALVALGLVLFSGPAVAAPPESISLLQTLAPWQYPGSEMPHGARMSDGGNRSVQSVQCQADLTTADPIDKVIAFYTKLAGPGEKVTDPGSVSARDDSRGRPLTLHVITVDKADTSTTIVITRGADEKATHILWMHYIRSEGTR